MFEATPTVPPLIAKRNELLRLLQNMGSVAVALSGGVDSAVVAQAAYTACGRNAVAVTAVSSSLADGELGQAQQLATKIGIRHVILETSEFSNPDYLKNAKDRCFYCKTELYSRIAEMKEELGFAVIVNGANVDDQGDYRPGHDAANNHNVRSPLVEAGFTKADVRELALEWSLPVWDKPATPCLSSRIAYGLEVTHERVQRVDQAEQFLKKLLNLRELRVRHEHNDLARVELPLEEVFPTLDLAVWAQIVKRLKELGFKYVTLDMEGFRSGSMNEVLPLVSLEGTSIPA